MWHAFMLLVGLVAAAAGTPLRQAEAADDIARTLAEAEAGDYDLEAVDGGVGDDAGETVLDRDATPHDLPGSVPPAPPSLLAHAARPEPPRFGIDRRDRGIRPLAEPGRRHAWLQCFRF